MNRSRRPSIFRLGQIHDTGRTVHATGWGLGLCAPACDCHRHPDGRHLTVLETTTGGLGLVSHRPCDCCQPWTAEELAAIVGDFELVACLPTIRPEARR